MFEQNSSRVLHLYDVRVNDPDSELVDRTGFDEKSLGQISRIMSSLGALRDVEERLSEASRAYMRLGRNDMRALHFLIVTTNTGAVVTPGALAAHLQISTASIT